MSFKVGDWVIVVNPDDVSKENNLSGTVWQVLKLENRPDFVVCFEKDPRGFYFEELAPVCPVLGLLFFQTACFQASEARPANRTK